MRKPRNRRLVRKNRKHPKQVYYDMATRIQRQFREFCARRYIRLCVNYNDTDVISMNPVGGIPRDLLFVTDQRGFDARELFTWMLKTNADPVSRQQFTKDQRKEFAQRLRDFIKRSRKTQLGKKGFFSSHRLALNALGQYAKYSKNN